MTNVAAFTRPALQKLTEAESAQLVHDSYLAQIRNNLCSHCGAGERWIELYEVWVHPTRTQHSRFVQKRPTTRILQGFDLSYFEMPQAQVPVCSECIGGFEVNIKAAIPAASREEWARTLARKYEPEPTLSKGRPEPTLDQL